MKISELLLELADNKQEVLLEMPYFSDSELPVDDVKVSRVSTNTLKRWYKPLGQFEQDGHIVAGYIKNDMTSAIIGHYIERDDGVGALRIFVHLKFHSPQSTNQYHPGIQYLFDKPIQIDVVTAANELRGFGYGYQLYRMLLQNGFSVVSDTTQYRGGKALWQKIVKRSALDNHNVYIYQDDTLMKGPDGKPIIYDGSNIPDNQIWSTNKRDHRLYYTVLVARAK